MVAGTRASLARFIEEMIMPSFNFDSLAAIYDATRGYPDEVATHIAGVLDETVTASTRTRFLEIGVGTGRIALPLAARGRVYTGIDISTQMLSHLEEKLRAAHWDTVEAPWGACGDEVEAPEWVRRFRHTKPEASMRLAVADVHQMPLRDASFDVVIAVHVLHLVENWRRVLEEVRRVLTPGGMFLHCADSRGESGVQEVRSQWRRILLELGHDEQRLYRPSEEALDEVCASWGWQVERWNAITWERSQSPRQVLAGILRRDWSSMRRVPNDLFAEGCKRLERWAAARYGAQMDTPLKDERHFVISRYRVKG
ncbi:class I SAM-dependent methyltransferase [Ktedonospora formicarum]|uniref:class I SAM-dependent methyltransferase n=1 Tax=Ktedonospora formicarum TaxID=2778364 RepID=UPI001C68748E|nr:class I SAM-dependent methyltransferase [Ktedonospora formicarum]